MFDAKFIKTDNNFDKNYIGNVSAPLFRKNFTVKEIKESKLYFCGLGYGYVYINGVPVTDDILTAPVSSYDKLIWYNVYDITPLLKKGENIIAVILGNGFFNENFESHWKNHKAPFRDNPKFALQLLVDNCVVVKSDNTFKCQKESFVVHNQLRSGEIFDARLYNKNWKELNFDDSSWKCAVLDNSNFTPKRKLCDAEPIRECEEIDFISCVKTEEGYLLDFGVNLSGYIRAEINEKYGTEVSFSHAEEIDENNKLKLNGLNILYPSVDFQVDKYICGEYPIKWSPKFTYHGFRYVLVKGLSESPKKGTVKAIFIHQTVELLTTFNCSSKLINDIYGAGIKSVYSNMHYALTDCPTREKFGWTNDAQASAEQICINFDVSKFFKKWIEDFKSVFDIDKGLPCIVPTHGDYGYFWGPVNDGAFFEIPYRYYQYTGDNQILTECLPYFKQYFDFYLSNKNVQDIWLGDWDGLNNRGIDFEFIKLFYTVKFCDIICLTSKLLGENFDYYLSIKENALNELNKFINEDGTSKIDNQTATSMLLCIGVGCKEKLIIQLVKNIEEKNNHFNVGMLGIQYIYDALSTNGKADLVYDAISADDPPSFKNWFDKGATTLWETWVDKVTDSRNHHMFSNVLGWFFKYLLGIKVDVNNPGYQRIDIQPVFISQLNYCKGSIKTPYGLLKVSWKRDINGICLTVNIPEQINAYYNNKKLNAGKTEIVIKNEGKIFSNILKSKMDSGR